MRELIGGITVTGHLCSAFYTPRTACQKCPRPATLAWAMTGVHEENPVRSRMEHTGETARQRARPPGP